MQHVWACTQYTTRQKRLVVTVFAVCACSMYWPVHRKKYVNELNEFTGFVVDECKMYGRVCKKTHVEKTDVFTGSISGVSMISMGL